MNTTSFEYGAGTLNTGTVIDLAHHKRKGIFSSDTREKIIASQQYVADIVSRQTTVYGVNTGFGILAHTKISEEDTRVLQHKILQSHSVGVGEAVPAGIARIMLITKIHALAQGYSGVQWETLQRLLWHLREDVIPVVPEKGSVGASGDLAPLSHLFLPLIGLGEVLYKGVVRPTREVLDQYGLEPVRL